MNESGDVEAAAASRLDLSFGSWASTTEDASFGDDYVERVRRGLASRLADTVPLVDHSRGE